MFDLLLFILYLFLFIILPSICLLKFLKFDFGNDLLLNLSIIISSGIVFTTYFLFIIRTFGLGFEIYWLIPILSMTYLLSKKHLKNRLREFKFTKWKINKYILLVIILCALAQCVAIFRGHNVTTSGHAYRSLNDSMWNIALIGELYNHPNPQNPTRAGEMLKNYHYLYHLQLAGIHSITKIPITNLYFFLGPILTSFLFGLSLYTVTKIFTDNGYFQGLSVFLGFFSGNFSYFIYFINNKFDWKGSTFLSDQPFDQIINTQSIMGYGLFLMGIYLIYLLMSKDKNNVLNKIILLSLFAGSIYGFKSFAGIIFLAGLFIFSIYYYLIRKSFIYVFALIAGTLFFLPIFISTTDFVHTYLHFAPGWILSKMVSDEDKLNLQSLTAVEAYYILAHNTLGLIKIKGIEFLIYLFGNLGTRILGLIYLIRIFIFNRKGLKNENILSTFIFIIALIALFIPLFFNLGANSYNIVQFTPYALILYAIFTVLILEKLFQYFRKRNMVILGISVVGIVIIASIPVNIKNLVGKFDIPQGVVSFEEYTALNYLKNNAGENAVILADYRQFSGDSLYIPALSERRLYYASNDLASSTEKIAVLRDKISIDFFDNKLNKSEFLERNNISFIYLRKPFLYNSMDFSNSRNWKNFFENEKVLILSV